MAGEKDQTDIGLEQRPYRESGGEIKLAENPLGPHKQRSKGRGMEIAKDPEVIGGRKITDKTNRDQHEYLALAGRELGGGGKLFVCRMQILGFRC